MKFLYCKTLVNLLGIISNIVTTRFTSVRDQVTNAALQSGRDPESVKLVGVSKRQLVDRIVSAVMEGLREIGENRIQEAYEKRPIVEKQLAEEKFDISCLRWHMVGRLQSNKAAKAAALFDVIQSVENVKVAGKLSRTAVDLGKSLEVFIEVNTSGETTKGGVTPDGLIDLAEEIHTLQGIKLNGLMTIGPLTDDRDRIRTAFDSLRSLIGEIERTYPGMTEGWELSMGMSDDFPIAVAAGSTMVRIGTAIFGQRLA